jgi:DNA-3-methyladenine glycosylase I
MAALRVLCRGPARNNGSANIVRSKPNLPTTDLKRLQRCAWADADLLLQSYHDKEWGVPERDSKELWEMLMLEGFQAGLAWITILRKRDAFREAFKGFDPHVVARFKERDITRLLKNPGIVRSRPKIEATIKGAQIFVEMKARGEDFSRYVWGFVGDKPVQSSGTKHLPKTPLSEKISADLKARGFKFVGPVIVYAWMQSIGLVNDHARACFRRDQVAKRIDRSRE